MGKGGGQLGGRPRPLKKSGLLAKNSFLWPLHAYVHPFKIQTVRTLSDTVVLKSCFIKPCIISLVPGTKLFCRNLSFQV